MKIGTGRPGDRVSDVLAFKPASNTSNNEKTNIIGVDFLVANCDTSLVLFRMISFEVVF